MNSFIRKRRLRKTAVLRDMFTETLISPHNFIMPLFVKEGLDGKENIDSMPGQFRFGISALTDECLRLKELGISAVLLFGIPNAKNESATQAYSEEGIIQEAVRAIKSMVPDMVVITDVCLCAYTNNGHCGIVKNGYVHNDLTLPLLVKTALSHAAAGADIVAPSDMMDGRVHSIRNALDASDHTDVAIMSYASKFSSAFYGPFRDAACSAPTAGDRKSHQLNPANAREALHEALIDETEGADILMVKPALPYLDIISSIKQNSKIPVAAYQVSGEYAMLLSSVSNGLMNRELAIMETLTCIKRAGADLIITYFAEEAVSNIKKGLR